MSIKGELKVTPDVLRRQADEVENLVKGVRAKFDSIKEIMPNTYAIYMEMVGNKE